MEKSNENAGNPIRRGDKGMELAEHLVRMKWKVALRDLQ